jgi:hypothetical protein
MLGDSADSVPQLQCSGRPPNPASPSSPRRDGGNRQWGALVWAVFLTTQRQGRSWKVQRAHPWGGTCQVPWSGAAELGLEANANCLEPAPTNAPFCPALSPVRGLESTTRPVSLITDHHLQI